MPFSLGRLPVEEVLDRLLEAGRFAITRKDEAAQSPMYKVGNELVTIVDIEIQRSLIEWLSPIFPNASFVAEEVSQNEKDINIRAARDSEWSWIIDPIDGTTSYFSGLKTYGLQIALAHKGVLVAGWICCPELEKAIAADINGVSLKYGLSSSAPRKIASLSEIWMVLASGDFDDQHKQKVHLLAQEVADMRRTDSCAFDYMEMVEGKRDLLVYKRSYPWDHAPGAFLVAAQGGIVKRFDSMLYDPFDDQQGLLVSRDAGIVKYAENFAP